MNELVKVLDGKVVVTSREVAEKFGKEHKNVLQCIYNLGTENSTMRFFIKSQYENRGKFYPEYLMDRDGFSLLVMGFTGSEALKWKLKYIDAFNKMEEYIKNQTPQLSDYDSAVLEVMKAGGDLQRVGALKHFQDIVEKPLLETIEVQKPKVTIYDRFMETKFTFTSTQVAKLIGVSSAVKLNKMLNESSIIYKQGKNWQPYTTANKEWYEIRINEYGTQIRFTPKGVIEIAKMYDLQLNEQELNETLNQ